MAEIDKAGGVSRRGVLKVAAWAAPAVAVAVSAPLASASGFDTPTAYVTGTLTARQSQTSRTAVYSGGALTFDSAGNPSIDSGNITIYLNNSRASYTVNVAGVEAAYQAKGWVLVSGSNSSIVFTHPPGVQRWSHRDAGCNLDRAGRYGQAPRVDRRGVRLR